MIVNVGAGTTGVAVVTMGSIAVAKSVPIGGNNMDKKIKTLIINKKNESPKNRFLISKVYQKRLVNSISRFDMFFFFVFLLWA